jgi:hypothetical protein
MFERRFQWISMWRLWFVGVIGVIPTWLCACVQLELPQDEPLTCDADADCSEHSVCVELVRPYCDDLRNLCVSDADCAPELECRLRDEADGIVVTKETCEARRCACDDQCPPGYGCLPGGFFSGDLLFCGAAPVCLIDADCESGETCSMSSVNESGCPASGRCESADPG